MNPALRQAQHGFIDVELGDGSAQDGLALYHPPPAPASPCGRHLPVLVRVSVPHSEVKRARGAFASCDHYRAEPAAEETLHQLLSQHRSSPAPRASRQ